MPPQKVSDEEMEKLKGAMRARRTHKSTLARDILIVDTLYHTGLRRSELADLKVSDLYLAGESPYLHVRYGKGSKERDVRLNSFIRKELERHTRGKDPEESVFGLAEKSITGLIYQWTRKAGTPQLHPHSFRHKFATDILERGGSLRDVQALLGHESLGTTESYLAVTDEGQARSVELLTCKRRHVPGEPRREEAVSTFTALRPPEKYAGHSDVSREELYSATVCVAHIRIYALEVETDDREARYDIYLFTRRPPEDSQEWDREEFWRSSKVRGRLQTFDWPAGLNYRNYDGENLVHFAVG